MSQFQSLITASPLGLMYGSAGGFLSPENLVGRANTKFPPDAATVAGLLLNANREQNFVEPETLKKSLVVAGPFWAKRDRPAQFYVPISRHRVVGLDESDEWELAQKQNGGTAASQTKIWYLNQCRWHREEPAVEAVYFWQQIESWNRVPTDQLLERKAVAKAPWEYTPFLHPKIKPDERHVVDQDGLFLESAVQLPDDISLVYLTNIEHSQLEPLNGWYRFGGEGHLAEVESYELSSQHRINQLLHQPIGYASALITPGVWGSNQLSYRYPQHSSFPNKDLKLLTEKAVPYRYRIGPKRLQDDGAASTEYDPNTTGRLSRGRYAVPVGSVYVFRQPLNMTWWDFPDEWFPKEGFPLKHLGCGLCLPVDIQGVPECTEKLTA